MLTFVSIHDSNNVFGWAGGEISGGSVSRCSGTSIRPIRRIRFRPSVLELSAETRNASNYVVRELTGRG
jgi:hypothetical protein